MPLFETDRLIARQLSYRDIPLLTAMLGDPEVMKFSVRGVCDEEATRKFVDWCLECYAAHGLGPWAFCEKKSGDFIGFCGVGPELVADVEQISLGYRLARRFGLSRLPSVGFLHCAQRRGCRKTPRFTPAPLVASISFIPGRQRLVSCLVSSTTTTTRTRWS